jgi:predicted GNAT family acetyltransferase
MPLAVSFWEDPESVLNVASEFLASKPVLHNMILSLLHARMDYREPGRYWVASRNGETVGVVLQSPLTFAATLTPMQPETVGAMVAAITDAGVALPGVNGEAATAASFAGQWTERCKSAAIPFQGMRLYELNAPREIGPIRGALRNANSNDRSLIVSWVHAFQDEIHEPNKAIEQLVDRWLPAGQIWLWDDGRPLAMAVHREPVAGVVRIAGVYTPPEIRRHGCATACVHALSKLMREAGHRCALYTDLGNKTSNTIYRQIGYTAVAEVLRYRFE